MIVNQSIIISKRSISEGLNKIDNWIQNLDTYARLTAFKFKNYLKVDHVGKNLSNLFSEIINIGILNSYQSNKVAISNYG